MTESTVQYAAVIDGMVPKCMVSFVRRLARLERGQAYSITLIVPDKADADPQWVVLPLGRVENTR